MRPKQALRETMESAHRVANVVMKMALNLHNGFHEIISIDDSRVQRHKRPGRPSTRV